MVRFQSCGLVPDWDDPNPEPVADFVDVVCVGEGEVLIPALIKTMNEAESRDDLLLRLAQEPGFYVPRFYDIHYNTDGSLREIEPQHGAPRRVFTMRNSMRKQEGSGTFADDFIPASEILTDNTEMSGRYLMEISRGCSMGCRFCWAGYSYLAPRVFSAEKLLARAAEQPRSATTRKFMNCSMAWKDLIIRFRFPRYG